MFLQYLQKTMYSVSSLYSIHHLPKFLCDVCKSNFCELPINVFIIICAIIIATIIIVIVIIKDSPFV